ncbi:MAG TPA: HAD-IA family hydrolase [Candidatus Thermoplasmatota archaeon]|nr:HAD-IA family hydrolase [Candidatus Thermoplasmatota archaeon]
MTLRAVAFDLDSTLVDFLRYKRLAAEAAALAMVDAGLDLPPALATETLWRAYEEAGLDGDRGFRAFLENTCGAADPTLLEAGIVAYLRAKDAHLEPYPRTARTLVELVREGLLLAIVTDAPREKALARLSRLRLLPFFDLVVTRDDTLQGKADDQPYRQLLARLHHPPSAVLMVGDHPARDVRPARALGLWTAQAAYGTQPRFASTRPEDEPHFELSRIDELPRVVRELGTPRTPREATPAPSASSPPARLAVAWTPTTSGST